MPFGTPFIRVNHMDTLWERFRFPPPASCKRFFYDTGSSPLCQAPALPAPLFLWERNRVPGKFT